ncbi:retrovirus-related pol polyprotein from transposon TNT 1-94 [Tanacetum coccineum]
MKEVFEQIEAEVDQNAVDKKCDEIERKNLIIKNENLIADCLSKEVFYTTTTFMLIVYRFSDMHDAYTVAQKRIAELEAENSNLTHKIQNDDHDEMIKHFSKLENKDLNAKVNALQDLNERFRVENKKVKQHYKELYDSIKLTRAKTIEKITSLLTEIETLKAQIKGKTKCVTMPDPVKPKVITPGTIREIVEEARVEKPLDSSLLSAFLYTKHSQELLKYVIGTCPKDFNKRDRKIATAPLNRKKRVTFIEPGVKDATIASGSKLRRNTKKDKTLPAKSDMKKWQPTGRKFTLGEQCPLTRFTESKVVPAKQPESVSTSKIVITERLSNTSQKPSTRTPTKIGDPMYQTLHTRLFSNAGDRSRLRNFVKKFIGTVRFENDHLGAIMGYRDYVIGDSMISRVYYVEGLGHNLFSVGQFCDSDLEVAFRKHSCYVRDVNGVDLIKGNYGTNLYNISVEDMMMSSPICLLSKASKNKSWLWHRRLNHLNFGTINDLARKYLVRGLPRLKFEKDHLCSACQLGKSQKYSNKPKSKSTNLEVLNTLHMDLCGPMRVQTINGNKYILVIVDDYSSFTWVKFFRSKDETPEFVIKFLKQIQNDIVERQNRTIVEAARTMLIFSKAPMFLWAEAVAATCYTQNRSLIHTRHNKTPYELVHDKKPDLKFLRIFGALCYPTNAVKTLEN